MWQEAQGWEAASHGSVHASSSSFGFHAVKREMLIPPPPSASGSQQGWDKVDFPMWQETHGWETAKYGAVQSASSTTSHAVKQELPPAPPPDIRKRRIPPQPPKPPVIKQYEEEDCDEKDFRDYNDAVWDRNDASSTVAAASKAMGSSSYPPFSGQDTNIREQGRENTDLYQRKDMVKKKRGRWV